jgi:hypothetical protein
VRKHVRAPLHSTFLSQNAGYFPRTPRALLLALEYSEPTLFIGILRLLRGNLYLWNVCVVTYERPTTDHICGICQVVETSTPRCMFEAGMREATQEALAVLRHEARRA